MPYLADGRHSSRDWHEVFTRPNRCRCKRPARRGDGGAADGPAWRSHPRALVASMIRCCTSGRHIQELHGAGADSASRDEGGVPARAAPGAIEIELVLAPASRRGYRLRLLDSGSRRQGHARGVRPRSGVRPSLASREHRDARLATHPPPTPPPPPPPPPTPPPFTPFPPCRALRLRTCRWGVDGDGVAEPHR